MATVMNPRFP